MQQPTAYQPPPYIPECDADELPDGRVRIIHRPTGKRRICASWRAAHLRAAAIETAATWRRNA